MSACFANYLSSSIFTTNLFYKFNIYLILNWTLFNNLIDFIWNNVIDSFTAIPISLHIWVNNSLAVSVWILTSWHTLQWVERVSFVHFFRLFSRWSTIFVFNDCIFYFHGWLCFVQFKKNWWSVISRSWNTVIIFSGMSMFLDNLSSNFTICLRDALKFKPENKKT